MPPAATGEAVIPACALCGADLTLAQYLNNARYCSRRCGSRASYLRCHDTDRRIDARPFAQWLSRVMRQYGLTPIKAAHRYGIDPANLRRLLNGRKTYVSLSTVDHALSRSNTDLWELYDPETLAPLPRSTT